MKESQELRQRYCRRRLFSGIQLNREVSGANSDFAELKSSSIAGLVFVDANNNGGHDRERATLGTDGNNNPIVVTLTGTNDLGESMSKRTTTPTRTVNTHSRTSPRRTYRSPNATQQLHQWQGLAG